MSEPLDLLAGLTLEDGRLWGEVAAPFQWATARHLFTPDTPPNLWATRPRGGSKTTDLAAMCAVLLADVLTAGAGVDVFAASRDQARLLADALAGFVARSASLRSVLDVGLYKVTSASGAVLEILSADAPTAWGRRPSVAVADEMCQWPTTPNARTLWQAITSSLGKIPGARLVCLSTSGDPAHWTHEIYEQARASERWAVQEVPGPLSWVDPAYLAEQRAMLPASVYRRVHLNEWAAPEDRLTNVEDLAACVGHDGPLGPLEGTRYVIGIDLGLKHDRTVAAVCHLEGDGERRVILDRMEVWAGSARQPVDLAEVRDWLELTARSYRAPVVADPWQAVGMIQELRRRGVRVEEFTFSQQSVGRLATTLHTSIRDRRLDLPDDPQLLEELSNVRLRETSPNVYRMDHDPDKHDDRAIALALAAHELLTAPAPRKPPRLHVMRRPPRRVPQVHGWVL